MFNRTRTVGSIPWYVLGNSFLLAFAMWAPLFCVPPMEHILKEGLALTHTQAILFFIGPIIMLVLVALPAGLIADRIGVKKAAGIGITIIAISSPLRGIGVDATYPLIFTFLYGIGLGLSFPTLPKLARAWTRAESASNFTGILLTPVIFAAGLFLAITMPVIFPITGNYNGVFFICGIPAVLSTITWWIFNSEPSNTLRNDRVTRAKVASPYKLFKSRVLLRVSLLFFLHNFFFYTWSGWVPLILLMKGISEDMAGLITSVTLWAGIPAVLLMPKLASLTRSKRYFLWVPGILLSIVAWIMAYNTSELVFWLIMSLAGVALCVRFAALYSMPAELIPERQVGTATGILCIGYTGGIIGPTLGGYILDTTNSLTISLILLVFISIISVIVAIKMPTNKEIKSLSVQDS
ncbi:CynX/NimT family MFS transporter [Chloroflexota bacterium]